MTNIQLFLLANNNFSESTPLSHTQASYVYQFYHTNIARRHLSIGDFLTEFTQQLDSALKNSPEMYEQRGEIYRLIEDYLRQAEERFIQRQELLNNN